MYIYSIGQWLLFFYVYCFFGWIFESTFVSVKNRKLTNRGFMHGPFLPLYGSGAILALFVTIPVRDNYVLMYIFGAVAATILEYVTGVVMEMLFKVRYWDYSNQKFNFQGHICLTSTIAWGFLVIFLVKVVHQPIERLVMSLHGYLYEVLLFGITIYFVSDLTLSFREAIELRDMLVYVEKARAEMDKLKKRVDVVIAVADDEIGEKINFYKKRLSGYDVKVVKRLFEAHPTVMSVKFTDSLSELKELFKNNDIVKRIKNR